MSCVGGDSIPLTNEAQHGGTSIVRLEHAENNSVDCPGPVCSFLGFSCAQFAIYTAVRFKYETH